MLSNKAATKVLGRAGLLSAYSTGGESVFKLGCLLAALSSLQVVGLMVSASCWLSVEDHLSSLSTVGQRLPTISTQAAPLAWSLTSSKPQGREAANKKNITTVCK